MAQPTFTGYSGYNGDNFVSLYFDVPLDASNPPSNNDFVIDWNAAFTSIIGVVVDGAAGIVRVQIPGTLSTGDTIDIYYYDPSGGNDVNAIQGIDGLDAVNASAAFYVTAAPAGPSVSSIVNASGANFVPANASTITYTVTFDSSVTGVDAADFSLALSGTAQGTITGVSGSGTTYSVTVGALSGDGALGLNLNSSGTGIQDGSNAAITGGYTGQVLAVDRTAPSAPTSLVLALGSDSGAQGDGLSRDITPRITGVGEANAIVTMYDTDGTTVLGSFMADGSGNWGITSIAVAEGAHTFVFKQTDAAGRTTGYMRLIAI